LHEVSWAALSKRPFVWGTFVWNMFDFASDGRGEGERPGRNDKGLVTADRKVKKDAFFLYKARWNPEPMVYITSRRYTSRPAGETEVRVYSNCDSVFLTVNGKVLGAEPGSDGIFVWKNITLVQGENLIKVRGRGRAKEVEDECVWTAKSPNSQETK
jgi:beta-galactosidase